MSDDDERLPLASEEDAAFYAHATRNLPSVGGFSASGFDFKGRAIPYGVGPHSVEPMREAFQLAQPKEILEIGMAQGYSSSLFLEFSKDVRVTSVDISDREETEVAARILKIRHGDRHRFFQSDSGQCFDLVRDRKYSMIFIDGGHLELDVLTDICLGLKLKTPWFFFDDWQFRFGPGVQVAIRKTPLKLVKVWWNMAMGVPE